MSHKTAQLRVSSDLLFFLLLAGLTGVSFLMTDLYVFRFFSTALLYWYTTVFLTVIYKQIIRVNIHGLVYVLLSTLSLLLLYGLAFGVVITFGTLSVVALWRTMIVVSAVIVSTGIWLRYQPKRKTAILSIDAPQKIRCQALLPQMPWLVGVYAIVAAICVWFIGLSQSNAAIVSVWQGVSSWTAYGLMALMGLQVLLVVSKTRTTTVLLTLMVTSLLVHALVPAAHPLPAGGDVWRHIGFEQLIIAGESIRPGLTRTVETSSILGIEIPTIFVSPQQYAYGQLWGTMVFVQELTGASLAAIHRWFMPIYWGLLFPLFMYVFGILFYRSRRSGLWLALLGLMPFSLQAVGSLTMPVSFGVLNLCFMGIVAISFLQQRQTFHQVVCFVGCLFAGFFYPATTVLILSAVIILVLARYVPKTFLARIGYLATLLFIPAAILLGSQIISSGGTTFIISFDTVKQLIGQAIGWFVVVGPLPHDIASFNIFINQVPTSAYVAHPLLQFTVVLPVVLIVFFGIVKYTWFQIAKEQYRTMNVLATVTAGGWLAYIVGWFVLSGDNSIIRRLDPYLAMFTIMMGYHGVLLFSCTTLGKKWATSGIRTSLFLAVSLSGVFGMIVLLGPDIRYSSTNEYALAKELAMNDSLPACIIADPWLHLPLEALSHRKIIGGGFPIDNGQYGQAALLETRRVLQTNPQAALAQAFDATNAKTCQIVYPLETDSQILEPVVDAYGDPQTIIYGHLLWTVANEQDNGYHDSNEGKNSLQ